MEGNTLQDNILERLISLLGYHTIESDPQQLQLCADGIAGMFEHTSYTVRRYKRNDKTSMVITRGSPMHCKVFLYAHYSVMHGRKYCGMRQNGFVSGSGTMDMKGPLAVLIELMIQIESLGLDVGLICVPDKNIYGFFGLKYLLDRGYTCNTMIMPDRGGRIENIFTQERGEIRWGLTAKSTSVYMSQPCQRGSAIKALIRTLSKIDNQFPDIPPKDHHRPYDDDAYWIDAFNEGVISGGSDWDAIPEKAEASGYIRFVPGKGRMEHFRIMIEQALEPEVELTKWSLQSAGVAIDRSNPTWDKYFEAVRSVGREPRVTQSLSSAVSLGTKTLVIQGQPDGTGSHQSCEDVSTQALVDYYYVLEHFLLAGAQPT